MRFSPLEEKIAKLVDPIASAMGLELVSIQQSGESNSLTLQVMAENPLTRALSVDECTNLSRAISAVMDVEDPIADAYQLEISSPGIDRLLIRERDYAEYNGMAAKIEIDPPIEGQKRFRGTIQGFENNEVQLKTDAGLVHLPFGDIQRAKLVMTDELIKAGQKKRKELLEATPNSHEEEVEDNGTAASR
jgi:ribosome maturation factor RimP